MSFEPALALDHLPDKMNKKNSRMRSKKLSQRSNISQMVPKNGTEKKNKAKVEKKVT